MSKLVKKLKHWAMPVLASAALTSAGLFNLHEINPTGAHPLVRNQAETSASEQPKRPTPNLFAERAHLIEWAKGEHTKGELKAENGKLAEFIVRASTIQEALNEGYDEEQYRNLLTANLTLLKEHREKFAALIHHFRVAPKEAIEALKIKSLTGIEYIAAERNPLNLLRALQIGDCYSIWLHQLAVSPVDLKSEVYQDHVHTAHVINGKTVNAYPNPENKRGDLHDSARLLIKGLEKTQETEVTTGEIHTDAFTLPPSKNKFRTTRNPAYSEKLLAANSTKQVKTSTPQLVHSIMQLRNYPLALGNGLAGEFYRPLAGDPETEYDYSESPPLSPLDVTREVAKALEAVKHNKETSLKQHKPGTLGHKDVLDSNNMILTGAKNALHFSLCKVILSEDPKTRALRPVQVALLKEIEKEIQDQNNLLINHDKTILERDPLDSSALIRLNVHAPQVAVKYGEVYEQKAKELVQKINAGRISYDELNNYYAIFSKSIQDIADPVIRISLTPITAKTIASPAVKNTTRKLYDAIATFGQIEANAKAWTDVEETDKAQNLAELQKHEAIVEALNVPESKYFAYLKQNALAQVKKIRAAIAKANQK